MRTWRRTAIGLATLAGLAALWYGATDLMEFVSAGKFPGPADTWAAFQQVAFGEYANGNLLEHVLNSLKLITLGFLAGERRRRSARIADGLERPCRGDHQSDLPPDPSDPATRLDPARHSVAWPRRCRQDPGDLVRGIRSRGDQHLHRSEGDRTVDHRGRANAGDTARPFLREVTGPGRAPDDLHRSATGPPGELDNSRGGRARRCAVRPWTRAQRRAAGHLSWHDCGRDGLCGDPGWATTRALAEFERRSMPWMQVRA